MIIKIIWVLNILNIITFVLFAGIFIADTNGRNVDAVESGWTTILTVLFLLIIGLSILFLRISHSPVSLFFSTFFAALPLMIAMAIYLPDKLDRFKKNKTLAEFYYSDKTQRAIATAIEQNDITKVKELIKGQDLNIQGNKIETWDGLNYLQFAVRVRSNSNFTVGEQDANLAIVHILVDNGSATTPALQEALKYYPVETVSYLLDKGADPNIHSYISGYRLLFDALGPSAKEVDMAILLVRKGAKTDVLFGNKYTPVMYAARNAGTSEQWKDTWRFVRYVLEEAHADYAYTTPDGVSLSSIVEDIRVESEGKNLTLSPDFYIVREWLKKNR